MKNIGIFLVMIVAISAYSFTTIQQAKERVNKLTVGDVIEKIKQEVTCEWRKETVDNLKTGSMDQEVTGIVTTFMASSEVIQKAIDQGANFIITHEPTFYNHFDNQEILKNDPVQQAKQKLIEDNGIAIWRFHDHWHMTDPDGINKGMIE